MGFLAPKPKVIFESLNKCNDFIGKFLWSFRLGQKGRQYLFRRRLQDSALWSGAVAVRVVRPMALVG
jgi:hypothetical protein